MHSSDASNDEDSLENNEIITELVSAEARLKLEVIRKLIEPCDRASYGARLKTAAEKLGCSVRTIQRLVKLLVSPWSKLSPWWAQVETVERSRAIVGLESSQPLEALIHGFSALTTKIFAAKDKPCYP